MVETAQMTEYAFFFFFFRRFTIIFEFIHSIQYIVHIHKVPQIHKTQKLLFGDKKWAKIVWLHLTCP